MAEEKMIRVKFAGRKGRAFVTVYKESIARKLVQRGTVTVAEDQEGVDGPPELEEMTRAELLQTAHAVGITNLQKYASTDELITAIRAAVDPPSRPLRETGRVNPARGRGKKAAPAPAETE